MSNKRITELVPINPANVANNDLFAIADVSVPETKKITAMDLAAWVGASASFNLFSSSYSKTASYLLYNGYPNGTASYAISSSWAYLAYTAWTSVTSSNSITSSYSLTCSYCLNDNSGAYSIATASYLLYNGYPNGTASYAISASNAEWARTSSYVAWFGNNTDNGTVYRSISSSFSNTASVLSGVGGNISATASWAINSKTASLLQFTSDFFPGANGTASHARFAYSASSAAAVSNVTNTNIFREWGPITASLTGPSTLSTTASFGFFQVSGSNLKIIVEAWGNVKVPQSNDINHSGSIRLDLSESVSSYFQLDEARFQNYYTGSDENLATHLDTGSIICQFYLKGTTTNAYTVSGGLHRYNLGLYASNGLSFVTSSITGLAGLSSTKVKCSFKVNGDNVVDE